MRPASIAAALATLFLSCSPKPEAVEKVLTPTPLAIDMAEGTCRFSKAAVRNSIIKSTEGHSLGKIQKNRDQAYVLRITRDSIITEAYTQVGLFYAQQTLAQLRDAYGEALPCMEINDAPRFAYRGVMLDVSRHFFDKDCIKRQLKLWAKYKINRFHWHLTDGIAWRIEMKGYPELTANVEHYTPQDIREVLDLADSLHIDVIPEIEMFGHSEEVWKVYPHLFCTENERTSEYCIGKESVFTFLEDVLSQTMEMFDSEYIHIGGDEAYKGHWAKCPDCQRRMRENGLKNTDELQSWGIGRISRFINSKGHKMIGWDEILEGGLAPGAVVMSWRGLDGGIAAAAAGHEVIMTPGRYCYINNSQDDPRFEPVSQGGYLPLKQVYEYDPAMGIENEEYVMGVQVNLWTEYVATQEHLEYMLYPRSFALAEIGWSMNERKDWESFHARALKAVESAEAMGYNCFDLKAEKGDRTTPQWISDPEVNLALGKAVKIANPYHKQYSASGESTLTDGKFGSWECGKGWLGFLECDTDIVVDLGEEKEISEVMASYGQWYTLWIWMPSAVRFSFSQDGVNFEPGGEVLNTVDTEGMTPSFAEFKWNGNTKARYVRIEGLVRRDAAGAWLFTDEIAIR